MSHSLKRIKRPLVGSTLCFIIGIIGGEWVQTKAPFLPLFFVSLGILVISLAYFTKPFVSFMALGSIIVGGLTLLTTPVLRERAFLESVDNIVLTGTVTKKQVSSYNVELELGQVVISQGEKDKQLKCKVLVQVPLHAEVEPGDQIRGTGTLEPLAEKMNPSDQDYTTYLRSQNKVGLLKMKTFKKIASKPTGVMIFQQHLVNQIDKVFKGQDKGIMLALLGGDTGDIPVDTYRYYTQMGMVHVLSISGFHISLVLMLLMGLGTLLGIRYTLRSMLCEIGILGYTVIVGASMPTLRATIMASLLLLGRIIWEQEDDWTSLAVAALILLIEAPYQLFQPGFQLSFSAVGSLFLGKYVKEKWEEEKGKELTPWIRELLPWMSVTLVISPIIAYHFFEIPFLSTLFSPILLPLFSLLLILGWLALGMSVVHLPLAILLGKALSGLLMLVEQLADRVSYLPLSTWCTGQPGLVAIIGYYLLLLLIINGLWGKSLKTIYWMGIGGVYMGWFLFKVVYPLPFQGTQLYVGQGDGMVMLTPSRQILIIDGGPKGKGKTMERFVKYQGKKQIEAIIVSHSDLDHIGGILELLQTNLRIQRILISQRDDSPLVKDLEALCQKKGIPIQRAKAGDSLQIGKVKCSFLSPLDQEVYRSLNENSLSCLVQYGSFSGLWTGDLGMNQEKRLQIPLSSLTLLKVAHHGSRTSTSEKMLCKAQPKYAMISCGKKNGFGHPHQEVLDRLEKYDIPTLRTDKQGAICFKTDGQRLKIWIYGKGEENGAR